MECVDEDECASNPSACGGVGTCLNLPGGFECLCPEGYTLSQGGTDCVDVRREQCFLGYKPG